MLDGTNGGVYYGTNLLLHIDEWTGTPTGGTIIDTPGFQQTGGMERLMVGLKTLDGSFKGTFDEADNNGQRAMMAACLAKTIVPLKLYASPTLRYEFNAYVESTPITTAFNAAVTVSFNYKSDGDITDYMSVDPPA